MSPIAHPRALLALLLPLILPFVGCDVISPPDDGDGPAPDEQVTAGEPTFTVTSEIGRPIFRVAWTGDKLWATTDLDGSSQTPQRLMEIDPADGSVVQSFTPAQPMWSLDFANGFLMDTNTHVFEGERYAERYDPDTGAPAGRWTYEGDYEIYYYIAHDGESYRGLTNYTCDGANCQALVEYSDEGAVLSVDESVQYDDLTYGDGHYWAYTRWDGDRAGVIYKLDADLDVVRSYEVTDYGRFGDVQYANEIAMHLVYIGSNLWLVDRQGGFYRTSIQ